MLKIIEFLSANTEALQLVKEDKLSLVGVTEMEKSAVLEAFEENTWEKSMVWR